MFGQKIYWKDLGLGYFISGRVEELNAVRNHDDSLNRDVFVFGAQLTAGNPVFIIHAV